MPQVQLLAQTYNSITFQYRETDDENAILEQALELLRLPLVAPNGRLYNVPWEAKIGWNWGNYNDDPVKGRLNPGGLIKWNAQKRDLRKRPSYQLLSSHN